MLKPADDTPLRDHDYGRAVLLATSAEGVYLRSQPFQGVMARIERGFSALLGSAPDLDVRAGAVVALQDLERSAYLERFPQLLAHVVPHLPQATTKTAMTPAACLSLYPQVAALGPIAAEGLVVSIGAPCHRVEKTYGPARMRSFAMNELVVFGRPAQVRVLVDRLRGGTLHWLRALGLEPLERAANDPFYGRGSQVMAQQQRALQTKVEIVLPIGAESEVACLSFNQHGEFFSQRWEITLDEGGWAESACVGVGLERLTLALIERHGDRPDTWPQAVLSVLAGAPS